MFFTESEYLLHEGVAGKTVIEAVDSFLGNKARGREDVLDAHLVARHTGQSVADVGTLLAALAARAVLTRQSMVRCPNASCRTLTPAARVAASRADGDEEPCDGPCGQDLSALSDPEVVDAYKLVAQPVL
jgi:hypothetical protein